MNRQTSQQSRPVIRMRQGPAGRMGSVYGRHEKPKNAKNALKRLVKYLGSNVYLMLILIFVMLIATTINLLGPVIQGKLLMRLTLLIKIRFSNIFYFYRWPMELGLSCPFPAG